MNWIEELKILGIEALMMVEELDVEADADTIQFRRNTCLGEPLEKEKRGDACEFLKIDSHGHPKCKICKCYIEIKVKTKVNRKLPNLTEKEITHCPKGKWKDEHIVFFYNINN